MPAIANRIARGRTDLVFDHIASGGDPCAADDAGVRIISWCAYFGDVSAIRFLLLHGEKLDSLGVNYDLNGAAFHGHWRLCQFLLEQGADPDFRLSETGETALHAALSVANRPANELAARILLDAGADPNLRTIPDVVTGCLMRDARTKGEAPIHRAAAYCSAAAIEALVAAGASVDCLDSSGDTPLAWASWHHRPSDILRLLGHSGSVPLHPDAAWQGDHGAGWRGMDHHLLGKP